MGYIHNVMRVHVRCQRETSNTAHIIMQFTRWRKTASQLQQQHSVYDYKTVAVFSAAGEELNSLSKINSSSSFFSDAGDGLFAGAMQPREEVHSSSAPVVFANSLHLAISKFE